MKINRHIWKIALGAVLIFVAAFLFYDKESPVKAGKLEFSLMDSFGRQISSQDYEGVPIFLEFGACW